MGEVVTAREKRVHCASRTAIGGFGGVSHKPECEPGEPQGDPARVRCRYPFPRYIQVAWAPSEERPSWTPPGPPLIDPFNPSSDIVTTTVTPSGEDPSVLSLSFRLNDAIAKEYYDAVSKYGPNPSLDSRMYDSMGPDLYSLENAIYGKTLDVTTTTIKRVVYYGQPFLGFPPELGTVLCQETLTDTCQLRQVFTGALYARCNYFYYHPVTQEPMFPVLQNPGNMVVEVYGTIAAGLAVADIVNNPKSGGAIHQFLAGLLSYNGTSPFTLTQLPSNPTLGWPRWGRASFGGKILVNGQSTEVTGQAYHGFAGNMGLSPTTFTIGMA